MKKLLNLLLIRRPETENKWWHRLANVLIFGSTIIFLLFVSIIVFSDFEFRNTNTDKLAPTLNDIQLRQNIDSLVAQKAPRDVVQSYNDMPPLPKTIPFGSSPYKMPFTVQFGTGQSVDFENEPTPQDIDEVATLLGINEPEETAPEVIPFGSKPIIDKYYKSADGTYVLKTVLRESDSQIGVLFKNLSIVFFLTLAWFIFWESIVYRTLLYIIYGKIK